MIAGAKSLTYAAEKLQQGCLPSLWIRTAAGPRMGFGHLRRSLVIAEALRDWCRALFLLDPDDIWSRQHLEEQNFGFYSVGIETAWDNFPDPAAILIDTRLPGGLNSLIIRARARRVPVLSIHDLGLNMLASDKVIDGSVVPLNPQNVFPGTKIFSGADYMVLDPIYRILHLQNKAIRERIQSVVINLGGGNSGKYYWKVLKGLKLWNREIDVIGVPGFVSWGQEVFAQNDWSPLRFRWEKRNFERLLFEADLAITAGGIAAYEALCCGTPLLALSYDRFQRATIRRLKRSGACVDLGLGEGLVPDALADILSEVDADPAMRERLSANGKKIVDGQGVERVAQILRESIYGGPRPIYKVRSA